MLFVISERHSTGTKDPDVLVGTDKATWHSDGNDPLVYVHGASTDSVAGPLSSCSLSWPLSLHLNMTQDGAINRWRSWMWP